VQKIKFCELGSRVYTLRPPGSTCSIGDCELIFRIIIDDDTLEIYYLYFEYDV
jgi:hypothetical protein